MEEKSTHRCLSFWQTIARIDIEKRRREVEQDDSVASQPSISWHLHLFVYIATVAELISSRSPLTFSVATFTTAALTCAAIDEETVIPTEETVVSTDEEDLFLTEAYNPDTRF